MIFKFNLQHLGEFFFNCPLQELDLITEIIFRNHEILEIFKKEKKNLLHPQLTIRCQLSIVSTCEMMYMNLYGEFNKYGDVL